MPDVENNERSYNNRRLSDTRPRYDKDMAHESHSYLWDKYETHWISSAEKLPDLVGCCNQKSFKSCPCRGPLRRAGTEPRSTLLARRPCNQRQKPLPTSYDELQSASTVDTGCSNRSEIQRCTHPPSDLLVTERILQQENKFNRFTTDTYELFQNTGNMSFFRNGQLTKDTSPYSTGPTAARAPMNVYPTGVERKNSKLVSYFKDSPYDGYQNSTYSSLMLEGTQDLGINVGSELKDLFSAKGKYLDHPKYSSKFKPNNESEVSPVLYNMKWNSPTSSSRINLRNLASNEESRVPRLALSHNNPFLQTNDYEVSTKTNSSYGLQAFGAMLMSKQSQSLPWESAAYVEELAQPLCVYSGIPRREGTSQYSFERKEKLGPSLKYTKLIHTIKRVTSAKQTSDTVLGCAMVLATGRPLNHDIYMKLKTSNDITGSGAHLAVKYLLTVNSGMTQQPDSLIYQDPITKSLIDLLCRPASKYGIIDFVRYLSCTLHTKLAIDEEAINQIIEQAKNPYGSSLKPLLEALYSYIKKLTTRLTLPSLAISSLPKVPKYWAFDALWYITQNSIESQATWVSELKKNNSDLVCPFLLLHRIGSWTKDLFINPVFLPPYETSLVSVGAIAREKQFLLVDDHDICLAEILERAFGALCFTRLEPYAESFSYISILDLHWAIVGLYLEQSINSFSQPNIAKSLALQENLSSLGLYAQFLIVSTTALSNSIVAFSLIDKRNNKELVLTLTKFARIAAKAILLLPALLLEQTTSVRTVLFSALSYGQKFVKNRYRSQRLLSNAQRSVVTVAYSMSYQNDRKHNLSFPNIFTLPPKPANITNRFSEQLSLWTALTQNYRTESCKTGLLAPSIEVWLACSTSQGYYDYLSKLEHNESSESANYYIKAHKLQKKSKRKVFTPIEITLPRRAAYPLGKIRRRCPGESRVITTNMLTITSKSAAKRRMCKANLLVSELLPRAMLAAEERAVKHIGVELVHTALIFDRIIHRSVLYAKTFQLIQKTGQLSEISKFSQCQDIEEGSISNEGYLGIHDPRMQTVLLAAIYKPRLPLITITPTHSWLVSAGYFFFRMLLQQASPINLPIYRDVPKNLGSLFLTDKLFKKQVFNAKTLLGHQLCLNRLCTDEYNIKINNTESFLDKTIVQNDIIDSTAHTLPKIYVKNNIWNDFLSHPYVIDSSTKLQLPTRNSNIPLQGLPQLETSSRNSQSYHSWKARPITLLCRKKLLKLKKTSSQSISMSRLVLPLISLALSRTKLLDERLKLLENVRSVLADTILSACVPNSQLSWKSSQPAKRPEKYSCNVATILRTYKHKTELLAIGDDFCDHETQPNTRFVLVSKDHGKTWTTRCEVLPFVPRRHFAVIYDKFTDTIVLTGGWDAERGYFRDVWHSYDGGATWIQVNECAPWSARLSHSLVYCSGPGENKLLLMAGYDEEDTYQRDVWSTTDLGKTWQCECEFCPWRGRYDAGVCFVPEEILAKQPLTWLPRESRSAILTIQAKNFTIRVGNINAERVCTLSDVGYQRSKIESNDDPKTVLYEELNELSKGLPMCPPSWSLNQLAKTWTKSINQNNSLWRKSCIQDAELDKTIISNYNSIEEQLENKYKPLDHRPAGVLDNSPILTDQHIRGIYSIILRHIGFEAANTLVSIVSILSWNDYETFLAGCQMLSFQLKLEIVKGEIPISPSGLPTAVVEIQTPDITEFITVSITSEKNITHCVEDICFGSLPSPVELPITANKVFGSVTHQAISDNISPGLQQRSGRGLLFLSGGMMKIGDKQAAAKDFWASPDHGVTWLNISINLPFPARFHHSMHVLPSGKLLLSAGRSTRKFSNKYDSPSLVALHDVWEADLKTLDWVERISHRKGPSTTLVVGFHVLPDGKYLWINSGRVFDSRHGDTSSQKRTASQYLQTFEVTASNNKRIKNELRKKLRLHNSEILFLIKASKFIQDWRITEFC